MRLFRRCAKPAALITLALSFLLTAAIPLLACDVSGALYRADVKVTNNSYTATQVSVPFTLNTQALIDGYYVNSSLSNVALQTPTGTDIPFMPAVGSGDLWMMYAGQVPQNSSQNYVLYTGGPDMDGSIYYFPDDAGMTTSDSASLELGDNFELEWSGYLNTSSGSDKNLVYKEEAFRSYINADGNITATMTSIPTGFPTVAAVNGGANDWNTSHTVNLPAGIVSGNLLIVFFASMDNPVVTFPGGWTQLFSDVADGNNGKHVGYYRIADGSEGATITVTTSQSKQAAHISYRITDYDGIPEVAIAVQTQDPPNLTPSWGAKNTLWIAVVGGKANGSGVTGYPTNYTDEFDYWNIGAVIGSARRELNAASEDPGTFTTQGFNQVSATVAIAPALILTEVTATGVSSGEHTVSVALGDTPPVATWDAGITVPVSFGAGLLPVVILEEIVLGSSAATVTFSDILAAVANWNTISGTTSRHLVIIANTASDNAANYRYLNLAFNGDTGDNYNYQLVYGIAGSDNANSDTDVSLLRAGYIPGAGVANAYGGGAVLIPHAFNTANYKLTISHTGAVEFVACAGVGRWDSTAAIDSIQLSTNAADFISGSTFQLGVIDERYLIEEENLTSDGTFSFSGIPGTGDDLLLIEYVRSDFSATFDQTLIAINSDTTDGNYYWQEVSGSTSTTTASTGNTRIFGLATADNASANEFGGGVHFFPQYAEEVGDPIYLAHSGFISIGSRVQFITGRRDNVAAITSIDITPNVGTNFRTGSLGSLYRVPQTLIERQELVSPTTTITFSDIPQTYEALQIIIYSRSDIAGLTESILVSFNGDTTADNYNMQYLRGAGAVAGASRSSSSRNLILVPGATEGANEFGGGVVTIPQYAGTEQKHYFTMDGIAGGYVYIRSSRWESTDAITSITLTLSGGNDFIAGSVFELVGVMPNEAFWIEVDGVVEGIEFATAVSVPDNSNDWVFLENDVMPYMDYQKIWVGGTLQQHITWQNSTTFTDQSGNGHDATPTFRSTSTDPDVSAVIKNFNAVTQAAFSGGTGNDIPEMVLAPTESIDLHRRMENTDQLPGGEWINSFMDDNGWPRELFWFTFVFGIAVLLTNGVFKVTKDLFPTALAPAIWVILFASAGVVPWAALWPCTVVSIGEIIRRRVVAIG